jgi:hypothetical protein
MDSYGLVSVIGLAGVALLAYRAYTESHAAHLRSKARSGTAAPPRRRARRRRRRQ